MIAAGSMKVAALVPAHNERASLPGVIDELRRVAPNLDIVVIDDGSDDGTSDLLATLPVRRLRFPICLGIGSAMRAGIRYLSELDYDVVVRLDADGQHAAQHIAPLLAPLVAGQADATIGSRYGGLRSYRASAGRRVMQRLIASCLSWLTRQPVTDPTSGFWAFGPRALKLLSRHHPTGYPEPELMLLLCRNQLRVTEVAVEMRERSAGRSTLTLPRALATLARIFLAMIVVPLRATEESQRA
jgi:glycosyltransferase involved in cell wall biosynthesis